MKKRIGKYLPQKLNQETYQAYIPPCLPPEPPIEVAKIYPYLEKATHALGELNSIHASIPNHALFIYMYVRKEALLSSQIEGTQSSFSDLMLFENHQKPAVSLEDVEEVSNYVKAITYGVERLKKGFPLSLRLLKEIHGILLSGSRGADKAPGQLRRSQNWIRGTRPSTALFVPPPADQLNTCLSNLENFLHDESLPALVKAGIAHVQFETIHPFLDGNGRLGRLLITLLLCQDGLLNEPLLYLSLYLKQKRSLYYDLLQEVRTHGTWETWLEFFLEGVYKTAKQAVTTAHRSNALFEKDRLMLETAGRIRFSCLEVLETMKKLPQVTVRSLLAHTGGMTPPTARKALTYMVKLGILEATTEKKRDKIYVYRSYLTLLEEGTAPL